MARSRGGYSGYHGRRTLNDTLKLIAAVLAVLVGLLLAGLYLGRDHIVRTEDGLRLDLPFLQKEEDERPDPGNVSVVIQPEGEESREPEGPEPQPEPEEPAMLAMELPVAAVLDGTALQKLEEAGANALVLEMKDREGMLAWRSEQTGPYMETVNAKTQGINEALEEWNRGDVYTVARVCCFRDNTVPYYSKAMAIRSGGGNWRDELGLRRMNPASEEARNYLAALCGELASLGFDEILLEECAFPTKGDLNTITWQGQPDRAQVMETLLTQVEEAVAPYGAKLSLRTDRAVLTGEETGGGLTAAILESHAQRLWMTGDGAEPALSQVLADAGFAEPEKRLVELKTALGGEGRQAQAVLEQS